MLSATKRKKDQLYRTVRQTILIAEAILLTAASLIFYQYSISQLVQQMEIADRKILHTHMMSAEAMQRLAYKIAQQIGQDPQIAYLRYNQNFDSVQLLRSISQLNNYRACLPYIESIYVYNGPLDSVTISSPTEGGYDIPLIDEEGVPFFDESAVKILRGELSSTRRFAPIVHSVVFPDGKQDIYYTFVFSSGFGDLPGSDSVLVNFSSDWLKQIASEEEDSLSKTIIADEDGNIIFSTNFHDILERIPENLLSALEMQDETAKNWIDQIDGAKVLVSVLSSNLSGWRYIRMTPYSQVTSGMKNAMMLMLALDLGLVVLGLASGMVASRRIYTPIHRISTRLDNAEKERENLIRQRQWYRELRRVPLDESETEQNHAEEAGVILIVQTASDEPLEQPQRDELLQEQVRLTDQLTNHALEVHGLQMDDGISTALILSDRMQPDTDFVQRLCDALEEYAQRRFGCRVRLSASKCNSGAYWKSQGYRQAWEAMRYHILPRFDKVLLWEEIEAIDASGFVYPQGNERLMTDAMMNCNVEGAIERFKQIMTYSQGYTMSVIQLTISTLTITLLGVVEELHKGSVPTLAVARDALLSVPALDEVSDLDEILTYLQNVIKVICQEIERNRGNKYTDLLERINQMIRENYQNPECSLGYIADQIGLSSAYISRIYKQLTLRSIPDEIGACRMGLARKLLIERRDMSIEQIAEDVGFTSSSYFSKAFKKDHGVSPKEYRISAISEDTMDGEQGGEKNE